MITLGEGAAALAGGKGAGGAGAIAKAEALGGKLVSGDTTSRVGSSFGPNTAGAAERVLGKVVQSGGNKINRATADALNQATGSLLTPREWGRGLEALKKDLDLPNGHHGKITEHGHYLSETGEILGNILEYL